MTFKNSLLWIPLVLPIFCVDIVQRGFAAFAKAADFPIPHIHEALSIYFFVLALGVLIFGFLCDNYNSRKILLWAMIGAAIGMVSLPYTSWGFGLMFGAAASLIKVAPFSAPLKLIHKNEALNISPQAAAKNIAGALFTLFIASLLTSIGWISTTMMLGIFIIACGFLVYYTVPDDKVEGWKWTIFLDLCKDWKFWMMAVYFFLMCGWYYIAIYGFFPALAKAGYTKGNTAIIIAISFLVAGGLRFFVAWLGDRKLFGYKLRLPLLWIGTFGMGACVPLTPIMPLTSLVLFTFMSSIHTPNYWAYCKEQWGPTYIATVVSLGFFFMYLGAGLMYGKWTS
jgi:MFS family permease